MGLGSNPISVGTGGGAFVTLTGDKALDRKLERLFGPELLRVVKSASNKAMTPVRATARKRVAKKSKNTMKAIVKKQVTYKNEGNILTMVGVRRVTSKTIGKNQAASNLGHLLEKGQLLVKGGKLGQGGRIIGFVRPFPFMGPAWRENKGRIQTIYAREMETGIHREARKGGFGA